MEYLLEQLIDAIAGDDGFCKNKIREFMDGHCTSMSASHSAGGMMEMQITIYVPTTNIPDPIVTGISMTAAKDVPKTDPVVTEVSISAAKTPDVSRFQDFLEKI